VLLWVGQLPSLSTFVLVVVITRTSFEQALASVYLRSEMYTFQHVELLCIRLVVQRINELLKNGDIATNIQKSEIMIRLVKIRRGSLSISSIEDNDGVLQSTIQPLLAIRHQITY